MGDAGVAAVTASQAQIPGSTSKDVLIHTNNSFGGSARHRRTKSKSKDGSSTAGGTKSKLTRIKTTSTGTSSGTSSGTPTDTATGVASTKSPLNANVNAREKSSSGSSPNSFSSATTADNYLPHGTRSTAKETKLSSSSSHSSSSNKKAMNWAQYLDQKQLKFASLVLVGVMLLHQIPLFQPYTSRVLFIQYVNPKNGLARAGFDDIYYVLFGIVGFVFIRALFVQHILIWICHNMAGIRSKKLTAKFVEQSWYLIHYSVSFIVGLYIISGEDYMTSREHLWIGWPHYELRPFVKAFYLAHVSLWLASIYTLQVETRRKDHYQMTTHHIIASTLCLASHFHYYTRVGLMISFYMDFADIQLSAAKLLNYLKYKKLCDFAFVLFLFGWIISRHILYNFTLWSAMTDAFELIEDKCYYDDNGELVQCFSKTVHWRLVGLLIALQVILWIWFARVIRVLIGVIKGAGAQDNRSSDEEDDEEEDEGDEGIDEIEDKN